MIEVTPRPSRHPGSLLVTRPESSYAAYGVVEWQYHVPYRYCRNCGTEAGPEAGVDMEKHGEPDD